MTKDIWINLPVKDVDKSKDFFVAPGFSLNQHFPVSNDSACLLIGEKNVVVMLFKDASFKNFTSNPISDTGQGSEVLFSISAESIEEVDERAAKAVHAGGTLFSKPGGNQGWMYGCGFADPDGHRWNVLYMDMSKMPQQ